MSRTLDRIGLAVVATGLHQCVTKDGNLSSGDAKTMEKLFLSPA